MSPWMSLGLVLLTALIGLGGTYLSSRMLRKTGEETVAVTSRSAAAAEAAAKASTESAAVARSAAQTADRAAEQLHRFRLHDDTMKTLYWAADHAITMDSGRALLGLEVLAALVKQVDGDGDRRGREVVSITNDAVRKVAIPSFLSILLNAVKGESDSEGQADEEGTEGTQILTGWLKVSVIEINAANLLLAHAPELEESLRNEVAQVAVARLGSRVQVQALSSGRHHDPELVRERTMQRSREHQLGLRRGISMGM